MPLSVPTVELDNVHFAVYPTSPSPMHKVWWEQVRMPRFAKEIGADLLHVPYWAPPMAPTAPTVVTIHDIIPRILPAYRGPAQVRLYTAFVSAATSHARLILTDSEAARADILNYLPVSAERVRVVLLAPQDKYVPEVAPNDAEIRQSYGLAQKYVLYLGGFDIRKNLATAFGAFKILYESHIADTALVVGGRLPSSDTAFAPDPCRLALEACLPDDVVRFLGFVDEAATPAIYRGARAFLYPSRYEGFGLPAAEAIACGVPVVGSDASSLPEVVGGGGVLVPPDDVEGMAGALIQLVNDDAFYQQLRRQALRQAQHLSWHETATGTLNAYHAALCSEEEPRGEAPK